MAYWFFGVLVINKDYCKKIGLKRPSSGWDVSFTLGKIQQTGAKMGRKPTHSKPGFERPTSISNIVKVYWWDSGGKKSSDGLLVRVLVRYLCPNTPKTEAEHPPRPSGSSSSPQIFLVAQLYYKSLVYVIKGSCLDLCSVAPSGKIPVKV